MTHRTPADSALHLLRRRMLLGGMAAGLVPSLAGCGGGEVLFAPFFVFLFTGTVAGAEVSVSFAPPPDECSTRGDLPPGSRISVSDPFFESAFSCSYNGRRLQITLDSAQAPLVLAYDGRFSDVDTIVFTPRGSGGTEFTVTRNFPADPAQCPS